MFGTVSLHALEATSSTTPTAPVVTTSKHFVRLLHVSNSNLLALPSENDAGATIRDIRIDPASKPIAVVGRTNSNGVEEVHTSGVGVNPRRPHRMLGTK